MSGLERMKESSKSLIMTVLLMLASSASAATFYVKTDGNDVKNCLSWSNACKTLASAVGKAAEGDTVLVAGGIYQPTVRTTLKNGLSIIGGYNPSTNSNNSKKVVTVFSGDLDGNDTKSGGVTLDHSGIVGTNLTQLFYAADLSDVLLEGFTITGMKNATHGSAIWQQTSEITYKKIRFIGNYAGSLGTVLIYGEDVYSKGIFEDCYFGGNYAGTGGAINPHRYGHAVVTRTFFENNDAGSSGGAIYVNSGLSSLEISSSTFESNTAVNGGAIDFAAGTATSSLINITFIGNNASGSGGAIRMGNSGNTIAYSTFYNNAASVEGGAIQNNSGASNTLTSSLVLANTAGSNANINGVSGELADGGYNLIGYNGNSNAAFSFGANSFTSPFALDAIIKTTSFDNGGLLRSVQIKDNVGAGYARDGITNDAVPFYGVGQTAEYPFRTLADAHGALKSYKNYTAGVYYFNLGTTFGPAPEFAPILGGNAFSTYVDNDGYVLIASAGPAGDVNSIATETTDLTLREDAKLPASVVSLFNEEENIVEGLDRWVRSSSLCNGSLTGTDVRGLPRSDYVNETDPDQQGLISDCDIGAFEFNNGYRYDCHSEDGQRKGIVTDGGLGDSSAETEICFGGDLAGATPGALIDNLGSASYMALLSLLALFYRRQIIK